MREYLPNRRRSENTEFVFQGVQVDLQCGYYDDGRLGEVFMTTRRLGSVIDTMCKDTAILISIALQLGATIEQLSKSATSRDDSTPDGIISALCDHLIASKLDINLDL